MKELIKDRIDQISQNKLWFKISISIFIFFVLLVGVIYATNNFASKGELNDDGQINYADVKLLQLHLIHQQELPEDKLEKADMNNDGELTVTDLTILIQKIENKLNYEVTIRDLVPSNYYPSKGEEITLNFAADVNYDATIKTITVNGQEYELVTNKADPNQYEIKVNVGNTSGVKEYRIEGATLTNGKTVETDYIVKVDVLKEQPKITNWTVTENIEKSELNMTFDILDPDQALTAGTYQIIEKKEEIENAAEQSEEDGSDTPDESETETDYIGAGTLSAGANQITAKVEEGKVYQVMLCMDYNLDTDTLEQEANNANHIIESKDISLVVDYELELSDMETYRYEEEKEEKTQRFNIGEYITLKFNSTNATTCFPEEAIINNKRYALTKKDNTYTAVIEGFDSTGIHTIKIEKVILNNGKEIQLENKETQVDLIKNAPTIARWRGNENPQEKQMHLHLYIKDKDKAITDLVVKLLDEQNNEIQTQNITDKLNKDHLIEEAEEQVIENTYYISTIFDVSKVNMPDHYKVKVIASYNLLENNQDYTYTNEILLDDEIEALPIVTIQNVEVSNRYPEKKENITLTYQIETNKKEAEITHIMVNNLKCIATKHVDNDENVTYCATLGAGDQAGLLDLETTEFIFEGNVASNVSNHMQVDVLKDKPTSEAFCKKMIFKIDRFD